MDAKAGGLASPVTTPAPAVTTALRCSGDSRTKDEPPLRNVPPGAGTTGTAPAAAGLRGGDVTCKKQPKCTSSVSRKKAWNILSAYPVRQIYSLSTACRERSR